MYEMSESQNLEKLQREKEQMYSLHTTTQVTNYMHTFMFTYKYKQKGSESLGESSTPQAYMVVSHKFLPKSNSSKDLALPDFNRLVLWDIWKDDQDLVWLKWLVTLKPKAHVI